MSAGSQEEKLGMKSWNMRGNRSPLGQLEHFVQFVHCVQGGGQGKWRPVCCPHQWSESTDSNNVLDYSGACPSKLTYRAWGRFNSTLQISCKIILWLILTYNYGERNLGKCSFPVRKQTKLPTLSYFYLGLNIYLGLFSTSLNTKLRWIFPFRFYRIEF